MSKKSKQSKKKLDIVNGVATRDIQQDEVVSIDAKEIPYLKRKDIYSFPSKSACPRCRTLNTQAVSTQGNTQYRKCGNAVCRWTYKEIGSPVNI